MGLQIPGDLLFRDFKFRQELRNHIGEISERLLGVVGANALDQVWAFAQQWQVAV